MKSILHLTPQWLIFVFVLSFSGDVRIYLHNLLFDSILTSCIFMNGIDKKVQIDYPCNWQYKIIGTELDKIKAVIREVLPEGNYQAAESMKSSHGKYVSLNLTTQVADEEERHRIYRLIKNHADVEMVM